MNKHTILIVDDEPNILKSLKRLMIDSNYKLLAAESGEAGLDLLANNEVHLVISDYRMPGMNGVEFLCKVKEKYPSTMRLILSGFADAAAVVDAINDGHVYKFIPKPWDDQELLTTLKRALERYDLQRENDILYDQLQTRNLSLEEMMANLESMVAERTRDLEMKNRALKVAHSILDRMPIGVLGVDLSGMIVYMNASLPEFMKIDGAGLGADAADFLDPELRAAMNETANSEGPRSYRLNENCIAICSPLPGQAGVIVNFIKYCNVSDAKELMTRGR